MRFTHVDLAPSAPGHAFAFGVVNKSGNGYRRVADTGDHDCSSEEIDSFVGGVLPRGFADHDEPEETDPDRNGQQAAAEQQDSGPQRRTHSTASSHNPD